MCVAVTRASYASAAPNLRTKLVRRSRQLRKVLDDEQRQAQLPVERDRQGAGKIEIEGLLGHHQHMCERTMVDRAGGNHLVEQHSSARRLAGQ